METLIENKPLLYSILGSAGAVFILASGIIPELSASLQIETFTEEVYIILQPTVVRNSAIRLVKTQELLYKYSEFRRVLANPSVRGGGSSLKFQNSGLCCQIGIFFSFFNTVSSHPGHCPAC